MARVVSASQGVQTFAQVILNSEGQSSFRLPMRYPVEVVGEQAFVFSKVEMSKSANDFKFALVHKFSRMHSSINNMRSNVVKSWGLLEALTVSFMDDLHVLV